MKREVLAMALAAAVMGGLDSMALARTMTITANRAADGSPSSFDFAFENVGAATTNALWMATGSVASAGDFTLWTPVRRVALVPGDTTSLAGVPLPSGADALPVRFFLVDADIVWGADLVESIASTGTQYIQTEFVPTGRTRAELDFSFYNNSQNASCAMFYTPNDGSDAFAVLWGSSGAWWKFRYGAETCNTDLTFSGRVWPDKGRTLLCADANGVAVGGVTYDGTVPSAVSDFNGSGAMVLFASPVNGTLYNLGKWRLYSFKAWTDRDDPAPALDLVPCRKAGEACLFDRASGAFLENCGTGSFTAGADVAQDSRITGDTEALRFETAYPLTQDALFHVDAMKADSFTFREGQENDRIDRWYDCRGTGWYAKSETGGAGTNVAYRVNANAEGGLLAGRPFVDFGTKDVDAGYMRWYDDTDTQKTCDIREYHIVFSMMATAGQYAIIGGPNWPTDNAMVPGGRWNMFFPQCPRAKDANKKTDDTPWHTENDWLVPRGILPTNTFFVVSVVVTNNLPIRAFSFGLDRREAETFGNIRLCEAIVYGDFTNSTARAEAIHASLLRKWKGAGDGTVVDLTLSTAGATLRMPKEPGLSYRVPQLDAGARLDIGDVAGVAALDVTVGADGAVSTTVVDGAVTFTPHVAVNVTLPTANTLKPGVYRILSATSLTAADFTLNYPGAMPTTQVGLSASADGLDLVVRSTATVVLFRSEAIEDGPTTEDGATTWVRGDLLWSFNFTRAEMEAAHPRMERGIFWLEDEGKTGDGALYCAATNGMRGTQNFSRMLEVDRFVGPVLLEADVKGRDIERGTESHHAPKVYLRYTLPPGPSVTNRYVATPWLYGSFDWQTWCVVHEIPPEALELEMSVTLQGCPGEFWVDAVRVYRAREVPAGNVRPPDEIPGEADIPRGLFADAPRADAKRGVMSGSDMSESAFGTLQEWGANLIRLQMSISRDGIETDDQYCEAFAAYLDSTIAVRLDRCRRYGLKAVLDLHTVPGAVKTSQSSNMIPTGYDTTTLRRVWRMIVERFGGDPVLYGYDIVNEPSCTPAEWQRVFTEVVAEIRAIDSVTPVITESLAYYYPPEMNVIYSLHPYQPHALTHCGTSLSSIHWSYPSYINGVWWDRRQMRVNLEPAIRFQQEHPDARIYIGEFSCIAWVPGAAEWIRDMISLFEEYGWDWTYHAFREWQAWDVELEPQELYDFNAYHMKPAPDGARKRALLEGLSHNR